MNQSQLHTVVDILSQIVELLYQENFTPAYTALVAVIPQFEGVIIQLEEEKQQEMIGKLGEALSALEEKDATLLADILQYEILEELKAYLEE